MLFTNLGNVVASPAAFIGGMGVVENFNCLIHGSSGMVVTALCFVFRQNISSLPQGLTSSNQGELIDAMNLCVFHLGLSQVKYNPVRVIYYYYVWLQDLLYYFSFSRQSSVSESQIILYHRHNLT